MRIKHRNRLSQDTRAKKKLILEKMKETLQDISAEENRRLETKRIKLSNAEKRAKHKAEYEASRVLTEENKKELDDIFSALIQASTPEQKVKEFIAILDRPNTKIEIVNTYKGYSVKICPEFYEIAHCYTTVRRLKLSLADEENVAIEEYKKYLNNKAKFEPFVWGTPFVPEKDVSN